MHGGLIVVTWRHLPEKLLLLCLYRQHHRCRILLLRCCVHTTSFLIELIALSHEEATALGAHLLSWLLGLGDDSTLVLLVATVWGIGCSDAKGSIADLSLVW